MKSKISIMMMALLCPIIYSGCGSSNAGKPTEQQNVFASIEGLGDAAGDPEMFATAFVSGAAPENREDYGMRGYQVNGEPTFEGDSVTVPVKIFGGVQATSQADNSRANPSESEETESIWTLQRVDDQWKLKDAPLG